MINILRNNEIVIGTLFGKAKELYPKFHKFLKSKNKISALDLGCRLPTNLFMLYHVYETSDLIGLDKMSEGNCVNKFIEQHSNVTEKDKLNQLQSAKTFFDLYKLHVSVTDDEERQKINSQNKFNSIFTDKFVKSRIHTYLEKNTQLFDVIIISNVLHFFIPAKVEQILMLIKKSMKEDGLLIIRVQEKSVFQYKEFRSVLSNFFPKGELHEYYKSNVWNHSIFINHPNLT